MHVRAVRCLVGFVASVTLVACAPAEEDPGTIQIGGGGQGGRARAGGLSNRAGAAGKAGGSASSGNRAGAANGGSAGRGDAGQPAAGQGGASSVGGAGGASGTTGTSGAGGTSGMGGAGGSGGSTSPGPTPTPVDGCPRVRVAVEGALPVNVRPTPDTSGAPIGSVPNGTLLTTNGKVSGEAIEGDTTWYEVQLEGKKGYIGGIFVQCTTDEPLPADCPRVKLGGAGTAVNVRPGPNTSGAPVASLPNGTILTASGKVQGEAIDGNTTWYRVEGQATGYVSAVLATCTTEEPPKGGDGFYLPFTCGFGTTVTQGNNTQFSHKGTSAYAFDFGVGQGTTVVAMAAGTVKYAYAGTKPGDPCYGGGGQSCINAANYVNVLHADGTLTQYAHLSEVHVSVGAAVARGQAIGKSGNTGWSTGAHLHVERQGNCGKAFCQTIGLSFVEAGVPGGGAAVKSQNCP